MYTSLLKTAEDRRPTALPKNPPLRHPQVFHTQHLYGIPGRFFQQFPVANGINYPNLYGVGMEHRIELFETANPCGEYNLFSNLFATQI